MTESIPLTANETAQLIDKAATRIAQEAAKLLLTTLEVALRLGISESQVKNYIRDGRLRSVKLDASRRIRRADLDAYVAGLEPE